jgi:hypothetical protein
MDNSAPSWEEVLMGLEIAFRKRSTGTLVSLCSLHMEKTPSCRYYPQSGRFHCYGCGADGTKEELLRWVTEVRKRGIWSERERRTDRMFRSKPF